MERGEVSITWQRHVKATSQSGSDTKDIGLGIFFILRNLEEVKHTKLLLMLIAATVGVCGCVHVCGTNNSETAQRVAGR